MSQTSTTSCCTVVAPNGGDQYWVVGDHLAFKLGPEQTDGKFSFAEGATHPGGGPPPHVHHREDEMFYVLEGEFQFILADNVYSASAGDAFFLPRGIVHTFKNVGSGQGRLLVVTTPSGFEKFIPEAGSVCGDRMQAPPPINDAAIAKLMAACGKYGLEMKFDFRPGTPIPAKPADPELWVLGAHVCVKLTSENTKGTFSVVEVTCASGGGIPPHAHLEMDEMFYVLEGEFEFTLDGELVKAPVGTFIHVPAGIVHGMRNVGSVKAKLVDYHSPGGFEKFFHECGVPCTDRSNPPVMPTPSAVKLAEILQKYGMTLGA